MFFFSLNLWTSFVSQGRQMFVLPVNVLSSEQITFVEIYIDCQQYFIYIMAASAPIHAFLELF